jgi:hypothetical protein
VQVIDSDYVTNCRKELVENTVDIERGANIVVRSSDPVVRGQQVRDVDQGRLCSPPA